MSTDTVLKDVVNGQEAVNKAALIRKAFQILPPNVTPGGVIEYLAKEHNTEVSSAYVSMIKGQLLKKINNQSYEALRLARKLIREVGSAQAAKSAIDAVLEENEITAETRNRYSGQLAEIDLRLGDEEHPLDPKDKRELIKEKQKIARLLEVLEGFD